MSIGQHDNFLDYFPFSPVEVIFAFLPQSLCKENYTELNEESKLPVLQEPQYHFLMQDLKILDVYNKTTMITDYGKGTLCQVRRRRFLLNLTVKSHLRRFLKLCEASVSSVI